MTALAKLDVVEAKLLRRDPMSLFWGLIFPALLLVVLGLAFPGFGPLRGPRRPPRHRPVPRRLRSGSAWRRSGSAGSLPRRLPREGCAPAHVDHPGPTASPAGRHARRPPGRRDVAATIVATTIAVAVAILAFDVHAPRHAVEFRLVPASGCVPVLDRATARLDRPDGVSGPGHRHAAVSSRCCSSPACTSRVR